VRLACLIVVISIGLTACGGSASSPSTSTAAGSSASTTKSTSTSATASASGCKRVQAPAPKGPQHLAPPHLTLDPHRTYTITVVTNCGTFAFALDVRHSPKTSASIYYLVKRGFYDGLTFHRVVPGFVIQGGDPIGDGTGGPGYTVVEAPPRGVQYLRGDVAMAKTQAQPSGASGSQFFVVTGANISQSAGLTPDYALAGKVVSGMDVVEKIGAVQTDQTSQAPTAPVVMSSVSVSTR
jgi:peptidyl-prolyl cis-trans isomerase B (cyclophilin B)